MTMNKSKRECDAFFIKTFFRRGADLPKCSKLSKKPKKKEFPEITNNYTITEINIGINRSKTVWFEWDQNPVLGLI